MEEHGKVAAAKSTALTLEEADVPKPKVVAKAIPPLDGADKSKRKRKGLAKAVPVEEVFDEDEDDEELVRGTAATF